MFDAQSTKTGLAMLKDNYESASTGRNALTTALKERRKRLAQTRLGSLSMESAEPTPSLSALSISKRGL